MALPPAESRWNPEEPRHDRPDGQSHQRECHRRRRFVRAMPVPVAATVPAMGIMRLGGTVRHLVIRLVGLSVRVLIDRMGDPVTCGHDGRRISVGRLPGGPAVAAEERHGHQAEHVERRHQRGHDGENPDRFVAQESAEQDLVLAEEPGKRRDPGDRQRADHHREVGDGRYFFKPPILRMSCSPPMAWITEPLPRNSSALKNACVIR